MAPKPRMPKVRPGQPAGLAEFLLAPGAVAEGHGGIDDAAVGGDEQPDGQFGHGGGVLAGAVGDVDAALAGGGEVDRIDAGPGADDQRELRRRLDGSGGDLRGSDDEDIGTLDGGWQGRGVEVVADLDLEFEPFQRTDNFRRQLIDDQYVHGSLGGSRFVLAG